MIADHLPTMAEVASEQSKCERCWRFIEDVAADQQLPHRLPPLRRSPRRHRLPALHRSTQPTQRSPKPDASRIPDPTHAAQSQHPGSSSRSYLGLLLAITAVVIILDRITKLLIVHHLPIGSAHTVIPGVFRITHVLNTGAAFSMFSESASPATVRNALIVFSLVAVCIVFAMLWRVARTITPTSIALALILGGAIGNVYDRIRYHHVIDFIEVHIIHYHWPDFNVADSCIVIGACLLMIEIFRPQPTN